MNPTKPTSNELFWELELSDTTKSKYEIIYDESTFELNTNVISRSEEFIKIVIDNYFFYHTKSKIYYKSNINDQFENIFLEYDHSEILDLDVFKGGLIVFLTKKDIKNDLVYLIVENHYINPSNPTDRIPPQTIKIEFNTLYTDFELVISQSRTGHDKHILFFVYLRKTNLIFYFEYDDVLNNVLPSNDENLISIPQDVVFHKPIVYQDVVLFQDKLTNDFYIFKIYNFDKNVKPYTLWQSIPNILIKYNLRNSTNIFNVGMSDETYSISYDGDNVTSFRGSSLELIKKYKTNSQNYKLLFNKDLLSIRNRPGFYIFIYSSFCMILRSITSWEFIIDTQSRDLQDDS